MLRLSQYVRDSIAQKPPRPFPGRILIWNLTLGCNLYCAHCYAAAKKRHPQELSTEECLQLIDQFPSLNIRYVILSGGEPLLRSDLAEIAAKIREHQIGVGLSTNGLLLKRERLEELAPFLQYVGVSIDGPEEVHETFRGQKGSFQKALEGLLLAKEMGLSVGLRFTIAPPTVEHVPFLFELAEKHDIRRLYFSYLVPSGRGAELGLSELQKVRWASEYILDKVFSYVESHQPFEVVSGNNPSEGVLLYQKFRERYPQQAEYLWKRLELLEGDQAGRRLMNITPLGEVRPDPFLPLSLGNVREQSLADIWLRPSHVGLRYLRTQPRRIYGPCGSCPFFSICHGGSRGRAYGVSGRLDSFDPLCLYWPFREDSSSSPLPCSSSSGSDRA